MNINDIIKLALIEDIGHSDISTDFLNLCNTTATAKFLVKQAGVICGLEHAKKVFLSVDETVDFKILASDGDLVKPKDVVATVTGKASSLLKAERLALNILQRLSGIASLTKEFVDAVKPYEAKILDTRKTTPLLRQLEKYAVACGGGYNHRFGLFDMIMLKENHIRAAGGITAAVNKVNQKNTCYKLEVETTNLDEVAEAVSVKADRVMLDNMSLEQMKQAVKLYKGQVELEASGGVNLETVNSIAACGVDYISVGQLTHSYKSLDISLLFEE